MVVIQCNRRLNGLSLQGSTEFSRLMGVVVGGT
jgi:hypothetical protein